MRTILAIGVNKQLIDRVRRQLDPREFAIEETPSSRGGFEFLRKSAVSLILLNNVLHGESFREFCILIRSQERFSGIPVLLLAEKEETVDARIEVLKSMVVNDYIAAPFLPEEIVAKINVFMELRELQEELEARNLLLKKIAITDELTRLFNRRYLFERLAEEIARMARHQYDLACCLVDLDHFKKVNDEFGHQTGDQVLVELSRVMRASIRSIDMLGRYGGEEFLVILPYTNLEKGLVVAERLRTTVKSHRFGMVDGRVQTLSIGLVSFCAKDAVSIDDVVRSVDEQLYLAKSGGRDKVCYRKYAAPENGGRSPQTEGKR